MLHYLQRMLSYAKTQQGISNMFNMRLAVKTALAKRNRTLTSVADAICKDRTSLTESLYNGNPVLETVKSVAYELDYKLSEFIALGEG